MDYSNMSKDKKMPPGGVMIKSKTVEKEDDTSPKVSDAAKRRMQQMGGAK